MISGANPGAGEIQARGKYRGKILHESGYVRNSAPGQIPGCAPENWGTDRICRMPFFQ